jgi:RNA polymerase sigma-54 factor
MTLMGLTAGELHQKIESELASNPALELVEDRFCPACRRRLVEAGPCPVCSRPSSLASEEPIVFVSPREDFFNSGGRLGSAEDLQGEEFTAEVEELPVYVLRQIAPDLDPDDRAIAAHILTSLDDDGLLTQSLLEVARYHHVPLSRVEKVLRLIQHADPLGVGSPSPQAALLIQLEVLSERRPAPPKAAEAICRGMDLLSRRQYIELARLLKITTHEAKRIARYIGDNLNPFPARAHWGDIHQGGERDLNTFQHPDIIFSYLNDNPGGALVVEVVSPLAGSLRINPLFREALHEAPLDKVEQWQEHLDQASLLVKCLQQRNHTIVRLMQRLTRLQREFILHGDAFLSPVTRASLADELDVHESTISRAVSAKAVQLPNGRIVPLSRFFDRSLHIRTALRQIISQESKPLTDTQIAALLKKLGYPVARRTVAKYRSMEGILPANMRAHLRLHGAT